MVYGQASAAPRCFWPTTARCMPKAGIQAAIQYGRSGFTLRVILLAFPLTTRAVLFLSQRLTRRVVGILYSGNPDLPAPWQTKFSQRFGYWEWKMKLPHNVNGEGNGLHPTIWLWPIGLDFAPP